MGGDPVVVNGPAWVSFGSDGSVIGDGGCGPFVASWRWDGRSIDVEGIDGRPSGCDRLEGSSLVSTSEMIVGLLADHPVPGPSEIVSGGLRLRAGTPGAATPWIELVSFDDLEPTNDPTAVVGRWITDEGSILNVDDETIGGETACEAPASWSLNTDGLSFPPCVAEVLGLTGSGPWELRSYGQTRWFRDGDRLTWWMRRDQGTMPSDYDDLVGGRWIVRGLYGVGSLPGTAWFELHADGSVRGSNGACGTFQGRWTLESGVLTGHGIRGPETSSCSAPPLDLEADLGTGLRLGRPEGASDQLELHSLSQSDDAAPWTLRRFDRIGDAASAQDILGMWEGQDGRGWGATFSGEGTVEISASGCREARPWSLNDGVLIIGESTDDSCRAWIVQMPLPGDVTARIDGRTLWLSGDDGVVSAVRLA